MRGQFFRFFGGFLLLLGLVLGIQSATFFLSERRQAERWSRDVFDAYVRDLSEELDEYASWGILSLSRLEEPLLDAAQDKVSAVLLKDADGKLVAYWGNPAGRSRDRAQELTGSGRRSLETRSGLASLAITQGSDGEGVSHEVSVVSRPSERRTLEVPEGLAAGDVAGTVRVSLNGTLIGSIDVLAFNPFSWQPTATYLQGLLWPYVLSVLAASAIALLLALRAGRRMQAYTRSMEQALQDLEHGSYRITLGSTPVRELRQINASVSHLATTLERNEETRHLWLDAISHDLNTPLASMGLLVDGMLDGVMPMTEDTMRNLKREADDLSRRIQRVILYANLLGPQAKAWRTEVPAGEFRNDVLTKRKPEDRKRIAWNGEDVVLLIDKEKMEAAAGELLDNALEASKEEVEVELTRNRLVVRNKGTLPENLDPLAPWTRGDQSRTQGGNGLGLPLVQAVAKLHHGDLKVQAEQGIVEASLTWEDA